MTRQEQIEEMAKIVDEMYNVYTTTADDIAEGLYNAGYRKTFTSDLASDTQKAYKDGYEKAQSELKTEIERLKAENEQLKVKLEKNPLAIKQKIMEEDDYELTEREQATLFLDRMGSDVEILHDIVENLDELLGKGIDEYIKGIDGVEGIQDMWERSAVREFAEKLRKRLTENRVSNDNVVINANYEIDELLKEYF